MTIFLCMRKSSFLFAPNFTFFNVIFNDLFFGRKVNIEKLLARLQMLKSKLFSANF